MLKSRGRFSSGGRCAAACRTPQPAQDQIRAPPRAPCPCRRRPLPARCRASGSSAGSQPRHRRWSGAGTLQKGGGVGRGATGMARSAAVEGAGARRGFAAAIGGYIASGSCIAQHNPVQQQPPPRRPTARPPPKWRQAIRPQLPFALRRARACTHTQTHTKAGTHTRMQAAHRLRARRPRGTCSAPGPQSPPSARSNTTHSRGAGGDARGAG